MEALFLTRLFLGSQSSGDFAGRAGYGNVAQIFEREDTSARQPRQPLDAREEGEQRDIAKCDAVPRGGKLFKNEAVDAEGGAKMLFKLCSRMARDFDGGELPHAGEEHVVVRARIFHQKSCGHADREESRRLFLCAQRRV